jgi:hypothetical protein
MFLDALALSPVSKPVMDRHYGPATEPKKPRPRPQTTEAKPVLPIRPPYADDIDAIVQGMIDAGDVVWDTAAEMWRKPHYRRFRFGHRD